MNQEKKRLNTKRNKKDRGRKRERRKILVGRKWKKMKKMTTEKETVIIRKGRK